MERIEGVADVSNRLESSSRPGIEAREISMRTSHGCDWGWLGVVAAVLLSVGSTRSAGADGEAARSLLRQGRAELEKGDPDGALTRFEQARDEDAELVEVHYWIGAALEKRQEPRRAVTAYQAFVDEVAARSARQPSARELLALQKKAMARIEVLAAADRAFQKARSAFADRAIAFARERETSNAPLAVRALQQALRAMPGHPDAAELLLKIGGDPAAILVPGLPIARVRTWRDIIGTREFGQNDGWIYGEKDVSIATPYLVIWAQDVARPSGPAYLYETDVEMEGATDPPRPTSVGLTFGTVDGQGFGVLMYSEWLSLAHYTLPGKFRTLERVPLPTWKLNTRRRLGVHVEGLVVRAFVDGARVLESEVHGRSDLAGTMGLLGERSRFRLRMLRFGEIVSEVK
jgi:tetratricopeptide (TPR) repeat protein